MPMDELSEHDMLPRGDGGGKSSSVDPSLFSPSFEWMLSLFRYRCLAEQLHPTHTMQPATLLKLLDIT